jgi:alpha 1,3-glucosidase
VILESGTTPATIKLKEASDSDIARVTGILPGKTSTASHTHIQYSIAKSGKLAVLVLQHKPLKADLFIEDFSSGQIEPAISVNERSLVYFEHRRVKGDSSLLAQDTALAAAGAIEHAGRKILDWGEDGKPIYEDGSHGDDGPHDAAKGAGSAADVAGRDLLAAASADTEPGMWEEKFGTHHDSKPHGPTSVGLDVTFPTATHVYGIPEHASTHALRSTDGSEGGAEYKQPYRLYNLDVFEYELDNPMALYGSIPFMIAHSPSGHSVGVFWNNPTETYVDINKGVRSSGSSIFAALTGGSGPKVGVATRWISESGVFDLSLVPGPSPKDVVTQYTSLTGTQELPPLFALGYHQVRPVQPACTFRVGVLHVVRAVPMELQG